MVINLLPIASVDYCAQNEMEPVFYIKQKDEIREDASLSVKQNKSISSFDQIVESIAYPFDRNDPIHMRLLDHFTTLFVGDTLKESLIILSSITMEEENIEPLNNILTELLLDVFSYYSTKDISNDFTSTIPFIANLFGKTREIWSQNFGLISQFNFEECYKMLHKVMIDDLNNDEESEIPNLKLYFYKYL